MHWKSLHAGAKIAIVFAIYVLVAKAALTLDAVSGFATLVWPPTGLALAALLVLGSEVWPGIFLGALVANLWTGAPIAVALGIALGNTLEAAIGAYAVRAAGFRGSFDRLRHVVALIAGAAAFSTLVSATLGVLSLRLGGIVTSTHQILQTWRAWWVGDVLGDLVVAPLLLTWATPRDFKVRPARVVEAIAVGAAVAIACTFVFARPTGVVLPFQSPSVLFPLFIWAAVRFELPGAATVTALASGLALVDTVHGLGLQAKETLTENLLALQTFMGCAALTPLVVAGALSDRARAVRTREMFVAGVSHDLKNPVSAIQMSAATLIRALPDVSAGHVEKHGQLVQRSVDRMTRLIADLLDAAAIDAGQLSVTPREENVASIVADGVDLMGPLAAAKGQDLIVALPEDLRVMCDHPRIVQVLSNLIGNAIKFSGEGCHITLSVKRKGDHAQFSVHDRGAGVEPGHLGFVFERYWRERPASGGGTGLGLFLTKGIIEAHRGKVWAESVVDVGSTFHFTLPLGPSSADPQDVPSQELVPSSPSL